jgi:hypothetical protein
MLSRIKQDGSNVPPKLNNSFRKINEQLCMLPGYILAYGEGVQDEDLVGLSSTDLRHIVDFYRFEYDRRPRRHAPERGSEVLRE